jgi:integrase/recombinase XerC
MDSERLDPWIEGYLDYLRDVGRKAHRTVIDIRCTLKRAVEGLGKDLPDVPLWKVPLEDYLRWFERARSAGRSPGSIAKDISHIRGLLDYAWRSGRADRNVLDGFQIQDANRPVEGRSLTIDEARLLVGACGRKTSQERRDRTIIILLYGCGLRTAELCGLDVPDVDRERQEIFVRHGKGDRERRIPVPDAVWTELLAYLSDRQGKRGPLFRTEAKKARLGTADMCEIVTERAKAAGLTGEVTPKTLRHTFGTHLMDEGVDLAVIASLMGHRSPQETGVYLHALPGRREQAVMKLTKLDSKEGRES